MKHTSLQIAIDGPTASGKSTVARALARTLHIGYLGTGLFYRMLALLVVQKGIEYTNEDRLVALLQQSTLEVGLRPESTTALLNSRKITDKKIATSEIGDMASLLGQHKKVRKALVAIQQKLINNKDIVVEGRDIGIRVLPHAQVKIYLTADLTTRIERRVAQFETQGIRKTFAEVKEEIVKRDRQDTVREIDPLQSVAGAFIFDTTHTTVSQTVGKIREYLKEKKLL